ncbi:hypothetical protein GCM10018954_011820 [Kutzneria kofuensis]
MRSVTTGFIEPGRCVVPVSNIDAGEEKTMAALYTAEAIAIGEGRNGEVRSSDGVIDEVLAVPTELGGPGGDKTNPEQLFAAGYAACFHSALQAVARRQKITLPETSITAKVSLLPLDGGAFTLAVELTVTSRASSRALPTSSWPRRTRCARTPTPPAATSRSPSTRPCDRAAVIPRLLGVLAPVTESPRRQQWARPRSPARSKPGRRTRPAGCSRRRSST